MKNRNNLLTITGVTRTICAAVSSKKNAPTNSSSVVREIASESERYFKGVPLSKLNELAKQIYHGLYCTIDQNGFLIFHHKSNGGRMTLHPQMTLDDAGKLINLGTHYPGQWWSVADAFVERANEMFTFQK